MPLSSISLSKTNTQKLFDCLIDHTNYKQLKDDCGVYCLFHLRNNRYIPLYVGSSVKLKIRATRFFRSQEGYSGNEYVSAIIKQVTNKKIVVGVKFVDCITHPELLIWERIYQEQIKPILNHTLASEDHFHSAGVKFFCKRSGLSWEEYVKKYPNWTS